MRAWRVVLTTCLVACTTSGNIDLPNGALDAGVDAHVAIDAGRDAPASTDAPSPGDAVSIDAPFPPADAGVDAAPDADLSADASDAATDAPRPDAAGDAPPDVASADAPELDASACPGSAGPPGVRVGSFCIDATEVTNADYAAFLAGTPPAQPPVCAWNTSFVPGAWPPAAGHDAYPVVAVDWCDAFAYCAWAGKRLCGAIGGGPTPFASYADPAASQWMSACSAGGARVFPYGDAYDPAACNGKDRTDAGTLLPAGALPACQGGAPGVFDMSGNVYEWEDACEGDAGASDLCHYRGGGYYTPGPPSSTNLECGGAATLARDPGAAFLDVGFRCCAP